MIPNFAYVVEGELAGSAHPGCGAALREALRELVEGEGVRAIVSLTEEPLEQAAVEEFGLAYHHEPIPDFSIPSPEAAARAIEFAERAVAEGGKALFHCAGGFGRTGTLLSCCLVERGMPAEEAIEQVRRRRPGSIETPEQVRFVHDWARRRRERRDAGR